jgi:hypothetical protein
VKPVSESILEHLQEFRAEFKSHPRLRIHVDKIEKESILVYRSGNGEEEREGCCIEGATVSDCIHKRAE